MRQSRISGRAGYTLVEMGIVVFVLGLMTVLSYFKLQPALDHGKVNGAASVMATDLQYAQMVAAKQRKPVVVIVTSATQSYVIRDRANALIVFRTRYFGTATDYALDEFSGTSTTLEVFPTGVTRSTSTFTLGLRGFRKYVKFTRAGQIRVSAI